MAVAELIVGGRAGATEFNKEKFKQVLHYIINKVGHLENVGKTVLFKLLYFTDFDFYELFEENLTGETYIKFDLGPAPHHFEEVIEELQNESKIGTYQTKMGEYEQYKFISLKDPMLDLLNGDEIQFIESDIAKYAHMNATQISAFSHEDLPYKATKDNEIIDYELVFYRDPIFSVREYEDD